MANLVQRPTQRHCGVSFGCPNTFLARLSKSARTVKSAKLIDLRLLAFASSNAQEHEFVNTIALPKCLGREQDHTLS